MFSLFVKIFISLLANFIFFLTGGCIAVIFEKDEFLYGMLCMVGSSTMLSFYGGNIYLVVTALCIILMIAMVKYHDKSNRD